MCAEPHTELHLTINEITTHEVMRSAKTKSQSPSPTEPPRPSSYPWDGWRDEESHMKSQISLRNVFVKEIWDFSVWRMEGKMEM